MTLEDFARIVSDELGVSFGTDELSADFDDLPEWDSLYLLKVVTAVESELRRSVPVGKVLEARSLKEIYDLAVTA
ncbi:phosphopantetheine-binding protein [Streptomyces sp. NPDC048172]|uniref:phosphopantetheine-binding protein n=1 Tax=Streptomyces sp. NPDC048172 TaxID=3365505 RepID=UPI0037152556